MQTPEHSTPAPAPAPVSVESWGDSRLYGGDNLTVLREHVADASVSLVYLDPPFNSEANYSRAGAGVAFTDIWRWDAESEAGLCRLEVEQPPVGRTLRLMMGAYGPSSLMAYLVMMAPRLVELHRVLRPHGTLYLHCDDSASHALRQVLDRIFGPGKALGVITWKRTSSHNDASRGYGRVADTILCYARGERPRWNPSDNMTDLWDDIPPLKGFSKERTGYPTQKPLALLRRVITVSSDPGDVVLDPFCGAGTTLVAAEELGRRWVGIDMGAEALACTRSRLETVRPAPAAVFRPPAGSLWDVP